MISTGRPQAPLTMHKSSVDYRLYLVTDSSPQILGSRDLVDVVKRALVGGVTCVQLRDKHSSDEDVIALAKKLHGVTLEFAVPLLINDRVDVALAVGCEGVHIGQDDTGRPRLLSTSSGASVPVPVAYTMRRRCHG